jgi:hypothetical protein
VGESGETIGLVEKLPRAVGSFRLRVVGIFVREVIPIDAEMPGDGLLEGAAGCSPAHRVSGAWPFDSSPVERRRRPRGRFAR